MTGMLSRMCEMFSLSFGRMCTCAVLTYGTASNAYPTGRQKESVGSSILCRAHQLSLQGDWGMVLLRSVLDAWEVAIN